jgi:hypothetical protein
MSKARNMKPKEGEVMSKKTRPPGTVWAVRVGASWAIEGEPYTRLTDDERHRFTGAHAKALAVKYEWRRIVSEDSFKPTVAKPEDVRLIAILPRVSRKPREAEVADAVVKALKEVRGELLLYVWKLYDRAEINRLFDKAIDRAARKGKS